MTAVAPKSAARTRPPRARSSPWSPRRCACAFVVQGIGSLFAGEWIADNLGEPYAPHPFREGGAGDDRRSASAQPRPRSAARWSARLGADLRTPLAIGFGLHGITEVGVFAAGVALHFTRGDARASSWPWPGGWTDVTPRATLHEDRA